MQSGPTGAPVDGWVVAGLAVIVLAGVLAALAGGMLGGYLATRQAIAAALATAGVTRPAPPPGIYLTEDPLLLRESRESHESRELGVDEGYVGRHELPLYRRP